MASKILLTLSTAVVSVHSRKTGVSNFTDVFNSRIEVIIKTTVQKLRYQAVKMKLDEPVEAASFQYTDWTDS